MPAPNLTILKRPFRTARLALASGPVHVPKTFSPAVTGPPAPALVTFQPIPRMGPPLRACTVGESVIYYGGDSYVRGGGAATGHTWHVYNWPAGALSDDASYLTDRGTEITGAQIALLDAGKTLQFTPTAGGMYAVEQHLAGATEGNGITVPLGYGVRFLKVFGVGGYDLEGIPEINGPNGSLDSGSVTLDLAYRRPDNLSGRQIVNPNMRICVNKRLSYGAPGVALTEYTWEPSGTFPAGYYAEEVLKSGLILGSTIDENARTHEVKYSIAGAQSALQLAQVPTITLQPTDPNYANFGSVQVAPSFFDQTLWNIIMTTNPTEIPGWVLLINGMAAEDAALAILGNYTNLLSFFDYAAYQSDTDLIPSTELSPGSIWDWLRSFEAGRFGRLYTDRKSIIYTGPDDDLRADPFRPSPVIALDGDLYRSIRVTHAQQLVGQVHVKSADTLKAAAVDIKVAPGSAAEQGVLQKVQTATYEALYPAVPGPGRRQHYDAARFFDQAAINGITQKLYDRDNCPFPAIELDMGMFPHLDLGQPLTVTLNPYTQEPAVTWTTTPLTAYVTGYSNRVSPDGSRWETTLTVRQATG